MTLTDQQKQFWRDVEALRRNLAPHSCPICAAGGRDEIGTYSNMTKVAKDLYQVGLRCIEGHPWSVQVSPVEAHAIRPPEPEVESEQTPVTVPGSVSAVDSCGHCGDALGKHYYAGVPLEAGKLDLCMDCWGAWQARLIVDK
jgi:hypothetical protein